MKLRILKNALVAVVSSALVTGCLYLGERLGKSSRALRGTGSVEPASG